MERTSTIPMAPRTELMKLLDELSARRIIYIHAPAGYGKTVSSLLWLEHKKVGMSVKQARLVLDEYDNKQSSFCGRFTFALLSLQPDNASLRELSAHPSFDTAPIEFTLRALSSFEDDGKEYILVIDDLHVIDNAEILKLLPVIIRRLPQSVIVLLLSRTAPPDSFSDMLVKDSLAIVNADHLSFTCNEIKSFFNTNGHHLTTGQAMDIHTSTGGWAISLRALLLSGMETHNVKITLSYLETFLKTYVWEKWDERLRNFMTLSSVVEELTPELCITLTGESSGAEMLEKLVRENAFLRGDGAGAYRFHQLFREFLLNMLKEEGKEVEQLQKAGDWYFEHGDYYRATTYFVKCKNYEGIARGFSAMYKYSTQNANLDARISLFDFLETDSMPDDIVDKNPLLYPAIVMGYYLGGEAEKFTSTVDQFKKALPTIKDRYPALLETLAFSQGLDFRQNLIDLTKQMKSLPINGTDDGKARATSLSMNMPFFHRSQRDYSEYVFDMEENLTTLRGTFGVFIGKEYEVIEDCIKAGLMYEQGKIASAHDYALSSNAKIIAGCTSEIKFCAMMILADTLIAGAQSADANKVLDNIESMIEEENAFYLSANLHAYRYRLKLWSGDADAAREWLKVHGEKPHNHLEFHKIYRHFTTARAYISAGDYTTTILFGKKLLLLSQEYRRPLDIIEANVLLAVAYWKTGGRMQNEALAHLENAILAAREYGYTQIFKNEGAELTSMLHKLQKRVVQKDYSGEITVANVKTLYIMALEHAKTSKGLTGGRVPKDLKFTEKQTAVMRYLCEGLTHKEIGERMGLKRSAVKSHMIIIYEKLDVSSGLDAILKIRELGVLDREL